MSDAEVKKINILFYARVSTDLKLTEVSLICILEPAFVSWKTKKDKAISFPELTVLLSRRRSEARAS